MPNIFDRDVTPGSYFARFYYVLSSTERPPYDEVDEELCNEGEKISLDEAIARARTLEDRHPDAATYEVVERRGLHWDGGWEWRAVTCWEVGDS